MARYPIAATLLPTGGIAAGKSGGACEGVWIGKCHYGITIKSLGKHIQKEVSKINVQNETCKKYWHKPPCARQASTDIGKTQLGKMEGQ